MLPPPVAVLLCSIALHTAHVAAGTGAAPPASSTAASASDTKRQQEAAAAAGGSAFRRKVDQWMTIDSHSAKSLFVGQARYNYRTSVAQGHLVQQVAGVKLTIACSEEHERDEALDELYRGGRFGGVSWRRDGVPIGSKSRTRRVHIDWRGRLSLTPLHVNDSGVYECLRAAKDPKRPPIKSTISIHVVTLGHAMARPPPMGSVSLGYWSLSLPFSLLVLAIALCAKREERRLAAGLPAERKRGEKDEAAEERFCTKQLRMDNEPEEATVVRKSAEQEKRERTEAARGAIALLGSVQRPAPKPMAKSPVGQAAGGDERAALV